MVYTVCASTVISPLRQWLDFYGKTRLKMCHTFKHFIHMQYSLLLTNLVIVFVHWDSTGVLYEPRQCSLFGDYIPECKLCFCVNLVPPVRSIFNPTNTEVAQLWNNDARWMKGATKNSAVALGSRNDMISIHQRSARTNEGKATLI